MLKNEIFSKETWSFQNFTSKIQHPQAWNSGNLAREFPAFTGIKSQ